VDGDEQDRWRAPQGGFEAAFAVLRLDAHQQPLSDDPTEWITVKEIVWTEKAALEEVERLNALNADKACRYFWRYTRAAHRSQ
jgi:hypothetical protein